MKLLQSSRWQLFDPAVEIVGLEECVDAFGLLSGVCLAWKLGIAAKDAGVPLILRVQPPKIAFVECQHDSLLLRGVLQH
ncbi:MAG TPA: hypothetical protein VMV69_00535 [Pirellulales bacterium]|nr:hypothetical protein [Pirellulales bacterium]